jgi:hypothetical protein
MDMQDTPVVLDAALPAPGSENPASQVPALLRGLLCSMIVLSLPTGAGVALIALASAPPWRLAGWRGMSARCAFHAQRLAATCGMAARHEGSVGAREHCLQAVSRGVR